MITKSLTKCEFHDVFRNMGREDQFSYAALNTLYDYLEQLCDETAEPYSLDAITLCCEYCEYEDFEALQNDYSNIKTMRDLEDNTTVINIDTNSFIIQQF